jgi:hypothetical protein
VIFCLATLGGLLVLALASAICLRASCVAPVRGGTYFSLPRQRKVGKRKPLNTASSSLYPRAPNGPILVAVSPFSMPAANASNSLITGFTLPRRRVRDQIARVL